MPTKIEWCDESWNPIRARRLVDGVHKIGWHCEHASPGCINCYAERINKRLGTGQDFKPAHLEHKTRDGRDSGDVSIFLDDAMLLQPLRWQRARMIFVCSMTDVFADFVPDAVLDKVFAIAMLARRHTFQVLTKRAARMRQYWAAPYRLESLWLAAGYLTGDALKRDDIHGADLLRNGWNAANQRLGYLPLPNVWSGVSVEDREREMERLPELLATPAAVRWVSAEPLLEYLNLRPYLDPTLPGRIDWVVAGGESGPHARPAHPDWFRTLRDQCAAAGVPFLFKQWGEWMPIDSLSDDEAFADDGSSRELQGRVTINFSRSMGKVGKKFAGRLLDGVQHDGYPEAAR